MCYDAVINWKQGVTAFFCLYKTREFRLRIA